MNAERSANGWTGNDDAYAYADDNADEEADCESQSDRDWDWDWRLRLRRGQSRARAFNLQPSTFNVQPPSAMPSAEPLTIDH